MSNLPPSLTHIASFFINEEKVVKLPRENLRRISIEELKPLSPTSIEYFHKIKIYNLEQLANITDESITQAEKELGAKKPDFNQAVVIARIIVAFSYGELSQGKIIFAGLDNAGKTSILLSLRNSYTETKEKGLLTPTVGATYEKISFAGIPIVMWDYGGQVSFRRMYLADDRYWANLRLLFVVIDVQDEKRVDHAIDYLKSILSKIVSSRETPQLIIVLHKADPELMASPTVQATISFLENKIKETLHHYPFSYSITKSSVYDRNHLLKEFSSAIRTISPVSDILDGLISDFCQELEASAIAIYSEQGFLLAEHCNADCHSYKDSMEVSSLILKGIDHMIKNPSEKIYSHEMATNFFAHIIPIDLTERIYCFILTKKPTLPEWINQNMKEYLNVWLDNLLSPTRKE